MLYHYYDFGKWFMGFHFAAFCTQCRTVRLSGNEKSMTKIITSSPFSFSFHRMNQFSPLFSLSFFWIMMMIWSHISFSKLFFSCSLLNRGVIYICIYIKQKQEITHCAIFHSHILIPMSFAAVTIPFPCSDFGRSFSTNSNRHSNFPEIRDLNTLLLFSIRSAILLLVVVNSLSWSRRKHYKLWCMGCVHKNGGCDAPISWFFVRVYIVYIIIFANQQRYPWLWFDYYLDATHSFYRTYVVMPTSSQLPQYKLQVMFPSRFLASLLFSWISNATKAQCSVAIK